jgi:hypothetical protein
MAARYRAYTESIGYRPRPTRSLLNEVHVLRDVSEAQALALSEYYTDRAFDPAETVELSGRTFRWEAIQAGAKGAFPTEALQSQGDRLTLLAMDVKRLTDYDPHLALWIAPWPETTLYWQGQAIWSYYRKAGNLCNPPLAAPENTVLIGLREVNRPVTIHFEGMRDALEVNGRRP